LAEQDLEEIGSYVAEAASPATTDRLIDAIIDRISWLGRRLRSSLGKMGSPGAAVGSW
jgi:plasmid stabilization system protein ParE